MLSCQIRSSLINTGPVEVTGTRTSSRGSFRVCSQWGGDYMARACSSTFMDAHSAWDLKGFDCRCHHVEFLSSSLSSFCAVVC